MYRSIYGIMLSLRCESSPGRKTHADSATAGCLRRNVGSPALKWELRAKPRLKTTEDTASRSSNIFTTGARGTSAGAQRGNKLGNATSGTRLHLSVPNGALLISERAPPSLSSYPVRSRQDALLLRCEEDTREVLLFFFFSFLLKS